MRNHFLVPLTLAFLTLAACGRASESKSSGSASIHDAAACPQATGTFSGLDWNNEQATIVLGRTSSGQQTIKLPDADTLVVNGTTYIDADDQKLSATPVCSGGRIRYRMTNEDRGSEFWIAVHDETNLTIENEAGIAVLTLKKQEN